MALSSSKSNGSSDFGEKEKRETVSYPSTADDVPLPVSGTRFRFKELRRSVPSPILGEADGEPSNVDMGSPASLLSSAAESVSAQTPARSKGNGRGKARTNRSKRIRQKKQQPNMENQDPLHQLRRLG